MESSFTSEINTMNYSYDILLKRKQEVCEKINMQRQNVHSNSTTIEPKDYRYNIEIE